MKIKFDSDDKVPLNKTIEILVIVIVARAVFDKNKNLFPSFFRRMFIRIIKMLQYDRTEVSEEHHVTKMDQKSVKFPTVSIC